MAIITCHIVTCLASTQPHNAAFKSAGSSGACPPIDSSFVTSPAIRGSHPIGDCALREERARGINCKPPDPFLRSDERQT